MSLILLNWNGRGVMSSAFSLSNLLETHNIDIALITEHKLLPRSAHFLRTIHHSYRAIYTVDDTIDQYTHHCDKDGTAILYKENIANAVSRYRTKNTWRLYLCILCVYASLS